MRCVLQICRLKCISPWLSSVWPTGHTQPTSCSTAALRLSLGHCFSHCSGSNSSQNLQVSPFLLCLSFPAFSPACEWIQAVNLGVGRKDRGCMWQKSHQHGAVGEAAHGRTMQCWVEGNVCATCQVWSVWCSPPVDTTPGYMTPRSLGVVQPCVSSLLTLHST